METLIEPRPANPAVTAIAAVLQDYQRQRAVVMKSRTMQANRLQAVIAGTLGYVSEMEEADRLKKFREAGRLIAAIDAGTAAHPYASIVKTTMLGINAFEKAIGDLEARMRVEAARLPTAAWAQRKPEQRGFGLLFLAIVVGEAGDLSGYANPGKLWRRLGCAPWQYGDKTLMGSHWRMGKNGNKLPTEEWQKFGYSPRRRAIAYQIGENIVRQNQSIYRARYDAVKAGIIARRPEYKPRQHDRHAMLLATKLLLKNLWVEWNG